MLHYILNPSNPAIDEGCWKLGDYDDYLLSCMVVWFSFNLLFPSMSYKDRVVAAGVFILIPMGFYFACYNYGLDL